MNINKHKLLKQFFKERGYTLADKYYWIKPVGEDLVARIALQLSRYGKFYFTEYSWNVPSSFTFDGQTSYRISTAVPIINNRRTTQSFDLNSLGIDEDEFVSELIKTLPFYMKHLESIHEADDLIKLYHQKMISIMPVGKNLELFGINESEFFKKTDKEKKDILNFKVYD